MTHETLVHVQEIVNFQTSISQSIPIKVVKGGLKKLFPRAKSEIEKKLETPFGINQEIRKREQSGEFLVDCLLFDVFVKIRPIRIVGIDPNREALFRGLNNFLPMANMSGEVFLLQIREFFENDNQFTLRLMALLACYEVCFLETQVGRNIGIKRAVEEGMIAVKRNKKSQIKLRMFEKAPV